MDGIINVYKEKGFTSFDVVAKLRGILHMKKIGHTGTLDPDATGVLPVCVGKGTRLCSLLEEHDKTYRAVLLLGMDTDTQDVTGKVLSSCEVSVTEEEVRQVLDHFRGDILQIPPMYSALKVNGKKLYEYAREGITIERKPRPVTVYRLEVERMELPRVTLTISCSKGTYIRTICHDIGEMLGCGGCMESLIRTQVGHFLLEDSLTLAQIEEKRDDGSLAECVLSVEQVFSHLPAGVVKPEFEKLVHNGNRLEGHMFRKTEEGDASALPVYNQTQAGPQMRIYDGQGLFIGVYEKDEKKKDWKPFRIFL